MNRILPGVDFVAPVRRRKYPHMRRDECNIWRRFLELHPTRFNLVAYDVRVGLGADVSHVDDESLARDWKMLTQKRLDVLGLSGGDFTVIEIKHVANIQSPGQCQAYCDLLCDTFNLTRKPNMLLLFQMIRPDVLEVCARCDVEALRVW